MCLAEQTVCFFLLKLFWKWSRHIKIVMAASSMSDQIDIIDILHQISRENSAQRTPLKILFKKYANKEKGITQGSLRGHWARLRVQENISVKTHALTILSRDQEDILRYTAQAFSAANKSLRPSDIRDIAASLWKLKLNKWMIKRWLKKERKELTKTCCVGLTKNRMDVPKMEADLTSWIQQVEQLHTRIKFPAQCIFNCDETRVSFKETGMSFHRIEWKEREKHNLATSRQERGATMLTFIAADGTVFFSLWIFKTGKTTSPIPFQIRQPEKTRSDGWPRYYAFSESGYINREIWGTIMLHFCDQFKLRHPGLHALLFSDQLGSHLDPIVLAAAKAENVHMWSLVANSSHFMQPLDDLPFGSFKKHTAELHSQKSFRKKLMGADAANLLLEAAYEAETLAFTKPIITGGFERTGLFPFDPEKLRRRFIVNTGKFITSNKADAMRAAASAVILKAVETPQARKRLRTGVISVRNNSVFSPEAIIQEAEDQAAADKAKKEAEKSAKLKATCRADGCPRTHRGGPGWLCCNCESVRLCPDHRDEAEMILGLAICECQTLHLVSKKQRTLAEPNPLQISQANPLLLRLPINLLLFLQN